MGEWIYFAYSTVFSNCGTTKSSIQKINNFDEKGGQGFF